MKFAEKKKVEYFMIDGVDLRFNIDENDYPTSSAVPSAGNDAIVVEGPPVPDVPQTNLPPITAGTAVWGFIFESDHLPLNDPYSAYVNYNTPTFQFDRDRHIQDAILNRVESDYNWARLDDDNRGYGQLFDPPPQGVPIVYPYNVYDASPGDVRPSDVDGPSYDNDVIINIEDSSSSNYSTPEWPFHSSDSDGASPPLEDGLVNNKSEVNTILALNIGPAAVPVAKICSEDSSPPHGFSSLRLKGPVSYDPNIEVEVFQIGPDFNSARRSKKAKSADGILISVHDSARDGSKDLHLPLKKRKCRSEFYGSEVPGALLDSVGHAKAYLSQLSKKVRLNSVGDSDMSKMPGGSRFHISIDDEDMVSSDDSA